MNPASKTGSIGTTYQVSDDGKYALAEFITSGQPSVGVRGVPSGADVASRNAKPNEAGNWIGSYFAP